MPLQNATHPTGHRPMSLLLQALKQIELKNPLKAGMGPSADGRADISAPTVEESPTAEAERNLPNGDTIELIRRYEASETASEIALAGPVHIAAVPLLATPARSESKSMTDNNRRRRRFADEVSKLLPHDERTVIALVPGDGIEVWPVVRELCRGLVAQGKGDVLAIAHDVDRARHESPGTAQFSDLLGGRERWQSAVRRDPDDGFFILERGDDGTIAASNGRSLLKMWQELNEPFAYVVVDAGRADPVAATSLLASCDATFAVVRLDRTNRREVERLITRIRSVGGRACGCLVVE
jgi:hypothetical protein